MKSIDRLYRLCRRRNIAILECSLPKTGSMSLESGNRCYIGIDTEKVKGEAELYTRLAHEVGHCVTGSFYSRYTAVDCRKRHENRADKWAVRRTISADALDKAIANGHTEIWDLADFFGVTEDFIKKAVCLYTYGNVSSELYFA